MAGFCCTLGLSRFNEADQSIIQRFGLFCSICHDVPYPKHCVLTKNCNHIFCKTCFTAAYATSKTCPTCRAQLPIPVERAFETNGTITRALSTLNVKCSDVCPWIGSFSDLTQHTLKCLNIDSFQCPNGCDQVQTRDTWSEHEKSCEHRIIQCEHCSCLITPSTTDVHLAICPQVTIDCLYKVSGCMARMRRQEIAEHLWVNAVIHAEQSNKTITELQQEVRGFQIVPIPILVKLGFNTPKVIGTSLNKTWSIKLTGVHDQLYLQIIIDTNQSNDANVIIASFNVRMRYTVKHPSDLNQDITRITEWRNVDGNQNQNALRTNLLITPSLLSSNSELTVIVERFIIFDWIYRR